MARKYTAQEAKERMAALVESAPDIFEEYEAAIIEELHETLERVEDFATVRFIQGQISGTRNFRSVEHE